MTQTLASEELRRVYRRRRLAIATTAVLLVVLAARTLAGQATSSESADASVEPDAPEVPTAEERDPCVDGPFQAPPADEPVPPELAAAIDTALEHRSFTIREASVSVWIDGYGEVAALEPELSLVPASNQKILVAMGALILLPHEDRLATEVRADSEIDADGVLHGDLFVIGGGDALIKREGEHSLQRLAEHVREAGITRITGSVLGDESRYDQVRRAPGWLEWQQPLPGGSMSALMVNSNSRIGAQDYLANPTPHNAALIAEALEAAGIEVDRGSGEGTAPGDAALITKMNSPTVVEMVQLMLRESDNMVAEMITKEIGLRETGEGSTAAGLAAIEEAVASDLCLELAGVSDDASGISRDNLRSAGEWRALLQAAQGRPWWPAFSEGLPVAAEEPGTLRYRFAETPAAGDLRAKTGSVGVSVALSGYLTTDGGRDVVFSAVVNGNDPDPAVTAIDQLMIAIARDAT